jgi:hypothetical protein
VAVARRLTTRQVRTFTGGSAMLRADGPACPFTFFAVRDPSAVKVKPLNKPPLENGFRHVRLAFNFERYYQPIPDPEAELVAAEVSRACASRDGKDPSSSAAFLMTIGLPISREERFFQEVVLDHPGQAWEDFYHRIAELSGRAGAE